MARGGNESGYDPAQPGQTPFDPEATQVVYSGPSPYGPSAPPPPAPPPPAQPPAAQPPAPPYAPPYAYGQPPNPTQVMPGYGAPAYGQPAPPPAPGKKRGALLAVTAGVVVLLLLAAGAIGIALLTDEEPRPEPSTAAPASTEPEPAPASTAPSPSVAPSPSAGATLTDLSSRTTDPRPVTVAELFPDPTIAFNGTTYTVLGTDAATNCRETADGKLATALVVAGCSQVVRATVAHPGKQYLVTVGVVNLPSTAAADQIYRLLDDPGSNGYFKRLNGAGVARDFAANRDTVVGSLARGHYVIFAVGGRAGSTGASLADEQLKATLKDMRLYSNETITKRTFE